MKKAILFLTFALTAFLIVFQFTYTPKPWIDEGLFTEMARNFAFHGVWGIQTSPGNFTLMNVPQVSVGYPVILPVALSLKIFGTGIWQARLPMLVFMFLLAVVFYLFVKKRYGFYNAIISVLLLISFAPSYGDGRPVIGEVPGLFFLVLGAYLLLLFEQGGFKSKKMAMLSGLAFGVACATKEIYLLGVSGALLISLIFWFKEIRDKKILWWYFAGFIPPILVWVYIQLISSHSLFTFIPSILHLASNHGSSLSLSATILLNFKRFFTESTPVLFSFLLVSILISFLYRYHKKDQKFSIAECAVLSFIILNWLGYLAGTGWYRYFFPANTLLFLLFPGAVYNFSKSVNKNILLLIPIALIIFQFYYMVFDSKTSLVNNRTQNLEVQTALANIDPTKKVFFYNTAEAIIYLKGDNYGQYFYCDGCNLEGGDKNALDNPSYDYILTDHSHSLPGYVKESVDEYYLFKKI